MNAPNRTFWHLSIARTTVFLLAILLLAVTAACGDDDEPAAEPTATPAPTATPTAEPEEVFIPERLFSVQISDDSTARSAAFGPDGEQVAGGTYLEAQILSVPDGELVRSFEYRHSVDDLQFSPDGETIAAGLSLYGVVVVNVEDGTEVGNPHGGFDNFLSISPDGDRIATGNRDGTLWVWDMDSFDMIWEAESPDGEWLLSIAYSPDGTQVASGYWDGTVHLWDAETGDHLGAFENPDDYGYATRIDWSPDGSLLAVAGASEDFQRVVRIWNVSDGTVEQVIQRESTTYSVAFSPDGQLMAIGDSDGISLWHAEDLSHYVDLEWDADAGESDWVTDLEFSPDSTMLVASRWAGYLELWLVQESADE